ncbi:MAG TPA: Uma2 family endonuclease [Chloroflexia bacterium]|nr:Uma2 family endonuclease [Chloroflexia bacterium]
MVSQPKPYYTPAEYLDLERTAEYKSEYLAGEIYALAGASEQHNTLTLNIAAELRAQFRGGPCRVYASDLRIKVAASRLYTYRRKLPAAAGSAAHVWRSGVPAAGGMAGLCGDVSAWPAARARPDSDDNRCRSE